MTAPWMPPLPQPVAQRVPNARGRHDYWDFGETYSAELDPESLCTADQMRQAQADAARAALEQAAKVSQNERFVYSDEEWRIRCELADAIRELAKEIT